MDGSLHRLDETQHATDQGVALDHLRLGWRPIVGRDRRVLGVRIEISVAPGTAETSSAATLGAVIAALADQTTSPSRGIVVLAPTPLSLIADLQTIGQWKSKANVMLEVDADALTARQLSLIEASQQDGQRFVLRSSSQPLPREAHRLFAAVIDAPAQGKHDGVLPLWVRDVHTRSDVEAAMTYGAQATIGWPLDEPMVEPSAGLEPTRRAVLDIVRLIQGDADVIALERAFKSEPSLALMLLSVINSPAFAPTSAQNAPITSLRHAILVLGYKRLVRWLVLLLGVSSASTRSMPLVYMAVQRGFFLEALASQVGGVRDDLFAVGAFSLLQQITGHSHERLFASAALPRPVLDAVRAHQGVYGVYLALAEVIERGDAIGSERAGQLVGVSMGQINAALLSSLAAADAITMN
ncbi:MAG: HDOD domain-containing protein [Pseudomonadota bacterium]|nr:HDOD domain-containing protein [Burkholderiaceae bacterium]MDQ3446123.1 HDOD domain-containing protein [Pseudomonadota bacterium]